jgi:hypothetical protein
MIVRAINSKGEAMKTVQISITSGDCEESCKQIESLRMGVRYTSNDRAGELAKHGKLVMIRRGYSGDTYYSPAMEEFESSKFSAQQLLRTWLKG